MYLTHSCTCTPDSTDRAPPLGVFPVLMELSLTASAFSVPINVVADGLDKFARQFRLCRTQSCRCGDESVWLFLGLYPAGQIVSWYQQVFTFCRARWHTSFLIEQLSFHLGPAASLVDWTRHDGELEVACYMFRSHLYDVGLTAVPCMSAGTMEHSQWALGRFQW